MSNKNDLFSIIIPIYNCDKYLSKCLDSLINQTYRNFELILINDGSTDKSGSICDEYKKKDSRCVILHKKNGGVSAARNDGLKIAKGKYVVFLDSDDYLDNNYLEYAMCIFNNYNIELLNTGFYSEVEVNGNRVYDLIIADEKYYKNKNELRKDLVYLWDKHMLYNVWNKVYLLSVIKNNKLMFPNYSFGEDMSFNIMYLSYINKFYNSNKCFYHYIKEREGSITSKYNSELFDIRVREYYQFNKYFEENGLSKEEYLEFSSRRFIERVLGCIENICGSNLSSKDKRNEIKKIVRHELISKTLFVAKLNSKKIKIMMIPIRLKFIWMVYMMGLLINKIRVSNPSLFNKLKNKR